MYLSLSLLCFASFWENKLPTLLLVKWRPDELRWIIRTILSIVYY